jgi:hypothetical protein
MDFCAQWNQTGSATAGFITGQNTGTYIFYFGPNFNSGNPILQGGTVSAGTWQYYTVTRSGNLFTLYIDGTAVGSTFTGSGTASAIPYAYSFGNYYNASNVLSAQATGFVGFLDEWRITTVCRYTGNFTPPTGLLPTS